MIQLLLAVIYLSFISLGLPDSLLGTAWPEIYTQFGVPVSYAGIISMIISVGTVLSSLQSDRLTRRLGTGRVTAISVAMTASALLGFAFCGSFPALCLWAIPYGLGAGSVDASLNNYVALHYESRHMSWLHCMWGVGASLGPYIMGNAISKGQGWNQGYGTVAILQLILALILLASLKLWKNPPQHPAAASEAASARPLTLRQVLHLPGTKEVMAVFFCYCAIEQTTGLWAGSYLVLYRGFSTDAAAGLVSLYFIGITIGRAVSGFLTLKLNDIQMVRLGQGIMALGILLLLLPLGEMALPAGLLLAGLGSAPIYPCLIHSTPTHFGADKSQAVIGIQVASAYVGILLMPPVFGLIAEHMHVALLPCYLLIILALLAVMHERLIIKSK